MGLRNFLIGWRSLGIRRADLVLEVGSGNRPLARSDVLCDLGAAGPHAQYGGGLPMDTVRDRPFVYADATRMPFRDGAFDYLYSAHMLEHLMNPAAFLNEARRVARRGCIVTPSPLFEGLFGVSSHLWYVREEAGVLTLQAKAAGDIGPFGQVLQGVWDQSRHLSQLVWGRPDLFETRYRFEAQGLRYAIAGQARAVDSDPEPEPPPAALRQRLAAGLRSALGRAIRRMHSTQRLTLDDLLACVACGGPLTRVADAYLCPACRARYPLAADGTPVLLAAAATPPGTA